MFWTRVPLLVSILSLLGGAVPANATLNKCVNALGMLQFFHSPSSLTDEQRAALRDRMRVEFPDIPPLTGLIPEPSAIAHNATMIRRLKEEAEAEKGPAISEALANQILEEVKNHPVAAISQLPKYDPHGRKIGLCYGRACAVHWTANEHGVPDSSIRKAFLIGNFTTKNHGRWTFHTGALIRGENSEGWWVVDPTLEKPLLPSEWLHQWTFVGAREDDDTGIIFIGHAEQIVPDPTLTLEDAKKGLEVGPYFRDLENSFPSRNR